MVEHSSQKKLECGSQAIWLEAEISHIQASRCNVRINSQDEDVGKLLHFSHVGRETKIVIADGT